MPAARTRKKYAVTIWLAVIAAASWIATGLADVLNTPEHIWHICLNFGTVASNAALVSVAIVQLIAVVRELHQVNDRMDRYYTTMAGLYRERADSQLTPQPWPALRLAREGDAPAARNGNRESSGA